MWCTSRASPHSTTRPTLVRLRSRTRWWCTAAVSSRLGIGACSSSLLRSLSTMIRAPSVDRRRHLVADRVQRTLERQPTAGHAVEPADDHRLEVRVVAVLVDVDDLRQLVVVDDRERQHELAAALRARPQQVGLRPERRRDGRDDLFADRVERWVGDLREQLREVVEQQAGTLAEHRDRRVGAHRAQRLGTGGRHRGDDQLQLLVRVAEHLLAAQHALVAVGDVLAVGQLVQLDQALFQPLAVGALRGQRRLDLVVVEDAPGGRVDQEHAPRLQPTLAHDLGLGRCRARRPRSRARRSRPSVTQNRPGRRPLRSSTAPITVPSVKHTAAGPSHGSISAAWKR